MCPGERLEDMTGAFITVSYGLRAARSPLFEEAPALEKRRLFRESPLAKAISDYLVMLSTVEINRP